MSRNLKVLLIAGVGVIAIVIVVVALSSGGGNKTTAATTTGSSDATLAWAGSVCGALTTWRTQVGSAGNSVAANPTQAGVEQGLADAKAATNTLKTTLKGLGLGTPTTSARADAQKALQQLKGQLQNDIAVIQRTVKSASATSASQVAPTVEAALATMRDQLAATGNELRSLPSGEAAQAFTDAPACKSLKSSSSK